MTARWLAVFCLLLVIVLNNQRRIHGAKIPVRENTKFSTTKAPGFLIVQASSMEDRTELVGHNATFSCLVSTDAIPKIVFFKQSNSSSGCYGNSEFDLKPLNSTAFHRVHIQPPVYDAIDETYRTALIIQNVTANDTACYVCSASSKILDIMHLQHGFLQVVNSAYDLPPPHPLHKSKNYLTSKPYYILLTIFIVGIVITVAFLAIVYWQFRMWRKSPLKFPPTETVLFKKRVIVDRTPLSPPQEYHQLTECGTSPTLLTNLSEGSASTMPMRAFPQVRFEKVSFRSSMPSTEFTSLLESDYVMVSNPDWEFPRECLKFHEEIGQGAFGRVLRAEAYRIRRLSQAVPITEQQNSNSDYANTSSAFIKRNSLSARTNMWWLQNKRKSSSVAADAVGAANDATTYYESNLSSPNTMSTTMSTNFTSSSSPTTEQRSADGWSTVAIKMLKEDGGDREMQALVTELELMMDIGTHPNIVNLLGCCTQNGPLLVVFEYAPYGNLRNFLHEHRTYLDYERAVGIRTLEARDLVNYAWQIACGMEYITSRKCVHRDLAARNILVGENEVLKVADFGLSRDVHGTQDIYTRAKDSNTRMPLKWMAPEMMFHGIYTPQSDVWSFAVVLWEIFSFGSQPYLALSKEDMYTFLGSGKRMDAPAGTPSAISSIMQKCWIDEPSNRPTFSELVVQLDNLLKTNNFSTIEGVRSTTTSTMPVIETSIDAPESLAGTNTTYV